MRHEIEVTCPADAIPEYFEFNLEGLEIGRSIHISAIKLPEGVKPTILNRDFTVATIAGHKIEEEADARRRGCGCRGRSAAPKARKALPPPKADAKARTPARRRAAPRLRPARRPPAQAGRRQAAPTGQEVGAAIGLDRPRSERSP